MLVVFLEVEMRTELLKIGSLILLTFPFPMSVWTQASAAGGQNIAADAQKIRMIRDPHNGMRWLLERAPGNSAGPGRMILLNDQVVSHLDVLIGGRPRTDRVAEPPVIRSGDRLVIEERSARVEARLEAISLGTAVQGAEFNARLAIGGKLVRAVALAPGRAAFASGGGAVQR